MDGSTDSVDMSLSKLWEIMKDREAWRVAVHEVAKSWTRLSNDSNNRRGTTSVYPAGAGLGPGLHAGEMRACRRTSGHRAWPTWGFGETRMEGSHGDNSLVVKASGLWPLLRMTTVTFVTKVMKTVTLVPFLPQGQLMVVKCW